MTVLKHRPEIDGLRAIAVIPVILFHAGFERFAGGFVGVDIFFVISGYLITGILLRELAEGRFSIIRFYERRVRRIMPALSFVILCCLPFAWAWMLPDQFEDFGQSLVATMLFASNILFWKESGYFGAASEAKPLLHTWSLAVEEQYYLFFPLLLWALWRFGRRPTAGVLLVLGLASLVLSEWGWRTVPDANFYLAPSRVWELLAGAGCAFWLVGHPRRASDLGAGAGLALILVSIFVFDAQTPFPSLYAIAPVLGTVLIILFAAPASGPVGRFLCAGPVVGIGLISYSAYLWHQPIFAFARIRSIHEVSPWAMLGLSAVSLVLAWLTWKYIENPFRRRDRQWLAGRSALFGVAAVFGGVIVALGLAIYATGGPASRPAQLAYMSVKDKVRLNVPRRCQYWIEGTRRLPALPDAGCEFPATTAQSIGRALVLGDSHAGAIAPTFNADLRAAGYDVTQITISGCVPFKGYSKTGFSCGDAVDRIHAYLAQTRYDLIVVSSRPQPLFADPFDNGEGGHDAVAFRSVSFDDALLGVADDASPAEKTAALYDKGLRDLAALTDALVLVYPVPEAGWNVPDVFVKQTLFLRENAPDVISTSSALFRERNGVVLDTLDAIDLPNLYRIRPDALFCDAEIAGRCVNAVNGEVLYRDDDHLSGQGAKRLLPDLDAILSDIARAG